MKNLKKLSRNELKDFMGSGPAKPDGSIAANDCHVHYVRNPDGTKGAIVSSGPGPCHAVAGQICSTYSSGSDGKCY